ncbi:MAG TPA: universal stress protein [Gaiella sp.]|jgi:nucleotide-binding universal stress UspA family protein
MSARPKRIVVGYDGSDAAQRALNAAADLVGYGSTLTVVAVDGDGLVDDARERLLRRHVTARYLHPVGDPAESLIEAARKLEADLLVVGRRGPDESDPGAVSSAVASLATCDVLVVG